MSFAAFNWTKVELKPDKYGKTFTEDMPFNWTKVELKPFRSFLFKFFQYTFNWTKVELKLILFLNTVSWLLRF